MYAIYSEFLLFSDLGGCCKKGKADSLAYIKFMIKGKLIVPNFDQNFEATRLAMLSKQHPDIVKVSGEVVFRADVVVQT